MAKKPKPVAEVPADYKPTPEELEMVRRMELPLLARNKELTERAKAEGLPKHKLDRGDLKRMNIPETFWSVTLKQATPSAVPYLQAYEKNFRAYEVAGCGLYLHGKPGVGKTGAAVTLLKFAREHYRTGYFIRGADYRDAVRYQPEFDSDLTVEDRMKQVDLLVIDAVSVSDFNPFFKTDNLMTMVSTRGEAGRLTIITTTISERAMTSLNPDFFESLAPFLQTIEVTGPNRGAAKRDELGKMLGKKGD